MKAELINGNLVITIPANTNPTVPSKTGKTLMVASTNGNTKTDVIVNGKPVVIGLNAYIYRE